MKYRFVDLVDIDRFRVMMRSFYEATALPLALIDTDNNILVGEGWQEICTRFHRMQPDAVARCYESDHFIAAHLHEAPFVGYRCLNGLMDYATPVVIEGEHVATMFTGQFLHEPPDIEFFRRQARQFSFDEGTYLAALAKVPVIPQPRAEAIMRFYAELAGMLADAGLLRLRQLETDANLAAANVCLRQRTAELEAANRELEEFSYSMSHDMRAPLRAIDGYSRILIDEHGDRLGAEGRRLLTVVRDNARHMGRQIDDILRFLRLGKCRMECAVVDMAALALEVFARLQAATPARRLRLDIAPLPPAWGDRDMLRELFDQLFANAIKFSPADGETLIELVGTAQEEQNSYAVRDHGVGFDMRYVNKLFKVFERVHPTGRFEGTGIGLALVKRIVDRHGGRVWAEGAVGAGATFRFSLPHGSN